MYVCMYAYYVYIYIYIYIYICLAAWPPGRLAASSRASATRCHEPRFPILFRCSLRTSCADLRRQRVGPKKSATRNARHQSSSGGLHLRKAHCPKRLPSKCKPTQPVTSERGVGVIFQGYFACAHLYKVARCEGRGRRLSQSCLCIRNLQYLHNCSVRLFIYIHAHLLHTCLFTFDYMHQYNCDQRQL